MTCYDVLIEFIESFFYEFGMPKRLYELIAKDKKFCILCFGPSFLL